MMQLLIEATKNKLGDSYIKAFLKRESGSLWDISEEEFLSLDWQQVKVCSEIAKENCKYYQAQLPRKIKAYTGVWHKPSDFEDLEIMLKQVHEWYGEHGRELYMKNGVKGFEKVNHASCIVGLHEGVEVIYTAYPGRFTASIKMDKYKDLSREELVKLAVEGEPIAIKLVDNKESLRRQILKIEIMQKFFNEFNCNKLVELTKNATGYNWDSQYKKILEVILKEVPKECKFLPMQMHSNPFNKSWLQNPTIKAIEDYRELNKILMDVLKSIGTSNFNWNSVVDTKSSKYD